MTNVNHCWRQLDLGFDARALISEEGQPTHQAVEPDPSSNESTTELSALDSIFTAALREVANKEPPPDVEARFYPYAGLSSTIRLRRGRVLARVSDILSPSPPRVLHALACILVAKLYRLNCPDEHERVYREYTSTADLQSVTESVRRSRGYKCTTSPRGMVYDLAELFDELNGRYFDGEVKRPVLSWSRQRTRRILGHHDNVHDAIIISRTLDSFRVPRFVLEYVLYHEMLHVKHPARRENGRTVYHSPQFRADERRFDRYDEAVKWLEQIVSRVRSRRRARSTRRPR